MGVKSKGNTDWYLAAGLETVRLISTYLFLTLQKMHYHKVKTSLSFSVILELQMQRIREQLSKEYKS